MKMTVQEYEELIAHFEFLEDKVESCYKRETEQVLERIKEKYKKYIVK
ncbi:MAG: hypothetical protein E6600_04470 [Anaerocolumna aminovalerica]|nr:hypothetical protein [Anaerocolumna aminovalerica]MDU6263736.1 hypothetical protein [Anaerocolumna aminovalerica]